MNCPMLQNERNTNMNATLLLAFYVLAICAIWLLPLYFICKYARNEQKNYNIVFLVGILTGWLIALIVALLLPKLSDADFQKLSQKTEREPMGQEGLMLAGLGVMTLTLVGFMAWMKFAL
jgi:uncharacterized membrane protein required for colicin V production